MKLEGWKMGDASYRAMLDYIAPKCYVEASSSNQGGTVEKVIYNRHKVPVCLKVKHGSGVTDYISVDRVDFWEPFDTYVMDLSEYRDTNEDIEYLNDAGFFWNDERGCFYNEELDEEAIY